MSSLPERVAAAIADFNNPFYAEERQRDVSNEADAFGFWLLFWTLLWGAGAVCWFFPSAHWVAGAVALWVLVAAWLTGRYARALGVDVRQRDQRAGPWHHVLVYVTGAWLGIGFAQALMPGAGGWQVPFLVTYLGIGTVVVLLQSRSPRRR